MAKAKKTPTSSQNNPEQPKPQPMNESSLGMPENTGSQEQASSEGQPLTSGKYIVILKEHAEGTKGVRESLRKSAGMTNFAVSSDFDEGVSAEDLASEKTLYFEKLGVMVVSEEEALQSLSSLSAEDDSNILAIEPEYLAYLSADDFPYAYLKGYRDAVNHLYDSIGNKQTPDFNTEDAELQAIFNDTAQFTWGLQATRVNTSSRTGAGIRVAVLDTGFDFSHPDFAGRPIISRTFSGFPVQDIHGHGTHCIGTALGPRIPASGVRRYGVAYGAQIYAGKIFNNNPNPTAPTSNTIAGIEWAMQNGCAIVSLSIGSAINQQVQQYSVPMQRALNAGTLVIAAGGNNANRSGGNNGFVESPANSNAAMAVGAIDANLRIANFSARSSTVTGAGGKIDIAGPGVSVYSSIPTALGKHGFKNGTSMATPHVAGIAALWAQATGLRGAALWNKLIQTTRALNIPSVDVGTGLVQAPQ